MKKICIIFYFVLQCLIVWSQDSTHTKTQAIPVGETAFTGSVGLMFPSTSQLGNPKSAVGLGGMIGGRYQFAEGWNLYGNLGYNRILKQGYRQSSVLLYGGGSFYPFTPLFKIGGELGFNFVKESERITTYYPYYGYYSTYWYHRKGVSLYLAGLLGYEVYLPFGRLSLEGRLGLTYGGLFIVGNVGLIAPVFD